VTADDWATVRIEARDIERALIQIKQSGHNDFMANGSHPGNISYTVSFDLRAMWGSAFIVSESIMWPENESSWNFGRENLLAEF
jgi:hypothetical protein